MLDGGWDLNSYIRDILSQPSALRTALEKVSLAALQEINLADIDRIIISGMGSSFSAAYPAQIELSRQLTPVQLVNAAELLHSLRSTSGTRTLLWLNSQSGRSAELVHLLEHIESQPPALLLTFVNDDLPVIGKGCRRHQDDLAPHASDRSKCVENSACELG